MKFARAIWKVLVGVKDALILLFMLLFFGALYAALQARRHEHGSQNNDSRQEQNPSST